MSTTTPTTTTNPPIKHAVLVLRQDAVTGEVVASHLSDAVSSALRQAGFSSLRVLCIPEMAKGQLTDTTRVRLLSQCAMSGLSLSGPETTLLRNVFDLPYETQVHSGLAALDALDTLPLTTLEARARARDPKAITGPQGSGPQDTTPPVAVLPTTSAPQSPKPKHAIVE